MYAPSFTKCIVLVSAIAIFVINSGYFFKSGKVIQLDISAVLNGRSVTTLTNRKPVTWTKGIDKENGYLTMSAARFLGDKEAHALPDNPLFPATQSHPPILLHYSNRNGKANQTAFLRDSSDLVIKVPQGNYTDLYLSLTSSYGSTSLQVELMYKDAVEFRNVIVPDWYNDIPDNDPDFSYVAHDMGKWKSDNSLNEKDHHNIDALNIHPNPKRILTTVKLRKTPGGYLLFWAATGVLK